MSNPDSGYVRPIYHIEWSLQYVWDPIGLVWEPMEQPGASGGGDATAANQVTEIARLTSILAQLDVALSTRASQATLASVLTQLDVALSTRASEATLSTRLSESDFDTKIGSLTEAAPGTDTASSGLNGRLQRIAQRITSLIALLPTALTSAGNFKVSIQEYAVLTASAPANSSVGLASAQVLASNANRKAAVFKNLSVNTISLGQNGNAAVLNSGITLEPGDSWTMSPPLLTTGQVNGIASAAASSLSVQEYT